ncbi:MAG: ion channel [Pyrinomonadaceae bacterium]
MAQEETTFQNETFKLPSPAMSEKDRDMGFGEKVSSESRDRLINRDGSFNVERTGLGLTALINPYHILLTMSWKTFIGLTLLLYLSGNLFFGLLYMLLGADALVDSSSTPMDSVFLRAFFFSVQTFATIGYGTIHPVGVIPNLLVTIESYYSMIITALTTGIVFARFARPTARILFSNFAVIAPFQTKTAFMLRIVNSRNNQMIEVEAKIMFSRLENENGRVVRRYNMLELERRKVSFLPLAWTIVHPIDEKSPLYNLTAEDLEKDHAEFAVLLSGMDETYAQVVHTRTSYKSNEIKFDYKFANIYNEVKSGEKISIDVRRLSKIEKI